VPIDHPVALGAAIADWLVARHGADRTERTPVGRMRIGFPRPSTSPRTPQGLNFLHREVLNVCVWFGHQGCDVDGEEVFAQVLT